MIFKLLRKKKRKEKPPDYCAGAENRISSEVFLFCALKFFILRDKLHGFKIKEGCIS